MRVVLIVEDDPAIRDVLRFLVEAMRMRAIAADTCALALREAQSHRPDLAVVDLGLPDRDGIELIQRLRAWSHLPIIVLSARIAESERRAAYDAGADEYVTKPFSVPELIGKMQALLVRPPAAAPGDRS